MLAEGFHKLYPEFPLVHSISDVCRFAGSRSEELHRWWEELLERPVALDGAPEHQHRRRPGEVALWWHHLEQFVGADCWTLLGWVCWTFQTVKLTLLGLLKCVCTAL